MKVIRFKFSLSLLLIATTVLSNTIITGCGLNTQDKSSPLSEQIDQPLVDSLITAYTDLITAAHRQDSSAIRHLLDPEEIIILTRKARTYGHKSLEPFLAWIVNDWPNLRIQKFTEMKRSSPYVRLTFTTNEKSRPFRSGGMRRFTFLLFKYNSGHWQFVTLSQLSREEYGLYGYALSYHETDLPPQLRFPRRF